MPKLQKKKTSTVDRGDAWRVEAATLAIAGTSILIDVLGWNPWSCDVSWIAVVLCGAPIVWNAAIGFFRAFNVKTGFLVATALVAALLLGETTVAAEVALIMRLGEALEKRAVARARSGIEYLQEATPLTARIVDEKGGEKIVPVDAATVGDRVWRLGGDRRFEAFGDRIDRFLPLRVDFSDSDGGRGGD